jgi:tetratricopeptide (TPR) repeat protein
MANQGKTEKMQFGSLLASLRRKQRMTAKELANLVGVSPPAVTQWEHGKRRPEDIGIILRLLTVLDATDVERQEVLVSLGYKEPLTQNLDDVSLLQWIDGKFNRIANLREETTAQIEDLKRIFQQQLLDKESSASVKEMTLEELKESARSLEKESRYREAVERYKVAFRKAIKDNASAYELGTLYNLAIWSYYALSEYEECISLANKIISLSETGWVGVWALSGAYHWLSTIYSEFGDYELALQYADKAIQAGSPPRDIVGILGGIKAQSGHWQEAEELLKNAVDLARESGMHLGANLNGLAWFYIKQERVSEAQENCLESLRLRLEVPDEGDPGATRGVAYCHTYMAEIYMLLNQTQWNIAEMCLVAAIELFSKVGDSRDVAEQYYNLAIIALERDHNPEIARRYAERFINCFKDSPFKVEQAAGKRIMGKVYAELGTKNSLAQALELLRESVKLLRSIGNKLELGLSCYELGRISKKLGHETEAVEYLREAKSIFQNLYVPGKNGLESKIELVEEVLNSNVLATTQCVGQ